ncbi:aminomethyltransferase, mitochondrial [Episyrphus balteatus]|uniref:aminomethyltransferase, mitochondrial n=1 Tax=Episyrphus balteatus TaxID=286459 RepID=UPI00248654A6|nr:aminomethyltransferase, mitochondrial [Episyrphus balteatus]
MSKITRCLHIFARNASTASSSSVEKTALYNFHVEKGGKVVNFGGYLLPVQYSDLSIIASHVHTRKHSSIFDVSHMLQTYVRGKDAVACFESICTADIKGLAPNSGTLTVFTNDMGNILDDLIVSKVNDDLLYVVSNAAMKQQDMEIMSAAVSKFVGDKRDVSIEFLSPADHSLIALQGPSSASALKTITNVDLEKLYFMETIVAEVAGVSDCRITRCGYTGEDGYEISVPSEKVRHLTETLLGVDNVRMAGLGARDSLRLEAGLCLYGSDIDSNTSPVEAALSWLVSKRRRGEANFPGATKIVDQLKNGVTRRRIGIRMTEGPPARAGVGIYHNDELAGKITSGCPSPSLGGNIAMGYISESLKKPGNKIQLKIRDKFYPADVTKMPFTPANYYTKPKN